MDFSQLGELPLVIGALVIVCYTFYRSQERSGAQLQAMFNAFLDRVNAISDSQVKALGELTEVVVRLEARMDKRDGR